MAISHNWWGQNIVRNSFNRFPLYSSKHLAYKDRCRVQYLHRGVSLSKKSIDEIKRIKNKFNSKRRVFYFLHLDTLTF